MLKLIETPNFPFLKMVWFLCYEIVIPILCSTLLGIVFARFLMAVIGPNVEEKDNQFFDEPTIEIDPAKALAKQVRMSRFTCNKMKPLIGYTI
jgi:hypothetical protein